MNKQAILKKIGGIIAEITEQFQYLSDNPENLNELELELFTANSHFLTEHIAILKKINESSEGANDIPVPESPSVAALPPGNSFPSVNVTERSKLSEEPSFEFGLSEEIAENDSAAPAAEPVLDFPLNPLAHVGEIELPVSEAAPVKHSPLETQSEPTGPRTGDELNSVQGTPEKENQAMPQAAQTTAADNPAPTLNDLLSGQTNTRNIASHFSQQTVSDLKSIISLNDKLLFVRDLFNGYSLAYSEAIELVNRLDNYEAAESFLQQNYALKNKWAEKQDTVDKFFAVLRRRYTK